MLLIRNKKMLLEILTLATRSGALKNIPKATGNIFLKKKAVGNTLQAKKKFIIKNN